MKLLVARKLAVRHTILVCLTASMLATLIISKCMHSLQACLFKYITVSAFCIYALHGEDAAKREAGSGALNKSWKLHCRSWKIMEKSWNCFFKFLWEP